MPLTAGVAFVGNAHNRHGDSDKHPRHRHFMMLLKPDDFVRVMGHSLHGVADSSQCRSPHLPDQYGNALVTKYFQVLTRYLLVRRPGPAAEFRASGYPADSCTLRGAWCATSNAPTVRTLVSDIPSLNSLVPPAKPFLILAFQVRDDAKAIAQQYISARSQGTNGSHGWKGSAY